MRRAYTAFLAGGTASGKSTVARELEELGARIVDLDEVAREVVAPRSHAVHRIAAAFGDDLVDPATGELNRALLAQRTFGSQAQTARLEAIEMPLIRERLSSLLVAARRSAASVPTVVEVQLLDRVEDLLGLVDDVVVVVAPLALRRKRAECRGMSGADFDRRVAHQPSEAYLRAHATRVIDNSGDEAALLAQVHAWWDERVVGSAASYAPADPSVSGGGAAASHGKG